MRDDAPPFDPQTVKGFLTPEEGAALTQAAREAGALGPIVEIGSWCGRSTLYLAAGARDAGALVFAIDHHRGSEEHQKGEEFHDAATWDRDAGQVDTLPLFRDAVRRGGAEDVVVAIVGRSSAIARVWRGDVGMVFIDGGHALASALDDWRGWERHVAPGGVLAIHDVIPDPAKGGRPPHEVYRKALASGLYEPKALIGTLAILTRSR